jgi:2-polyprenyl-3-methyl-5-hydroxy-6-metoxy-1,4-benzoquinol methylase
LDYVDAVAEMYDRVWRMKGQENAGPIAGTDFFAQHVAPPADVLDLGCGSGANALAFVEAGYNVTAVDVSGEAIRLIRACAKKRGLKLKARVGDVRREPQADYDIMLMVFVLNYLLVEDAQKLLVDAAARTRPGGLHVIAGYCSDGPRARPDRFFPYDHTGVTRLYDETWQVVSADSGVEDHDEGPQRAFVVMLRKQS